MNREKTDLLIGILEYTLNSLDMSDTMDFGGDIREILEEVNQWK